MWLFGKKDNFLKKVRKKKNKVAKKNHRKIIAKLEKI
jgi:hypothetical protein